ncbi:HNH endonuclease signature motif containing protein [Sanguibacter sp. HDW7]|uniref:HNH endonuclease signature motif containing protein n=1 Tax=Sanguibacter sp. HDW7 TaxID=2714931 RepID=UPI001409EC44|nr:HNH endonuclease signature motif containing protein [Sanguibacter sp. HDW7]QIK83205.1 DUF222 domain-containing protein [Sanguibacter sp. HDW7]
MTPDPHPEEREPTRSVAPDGALFSGAPGAFVMPGALDSASGNDSTDGFDGADGRAGSSGNGTRDYGGGTSPNVTRSAQDGRGGSQGGSDTRQRAGTSSTPLPELTSHSDFLAWQEHLADAHGAALRVIESIEAEQRATSALRLQTMAVLAHLSEAAAQVVWDPVAGRSRVQTRASEIHAARRSTVAEVATRTRTAEGHVVAEWDLAQHVTVQHPHAVDDLAAGLLSAQHLKVIAEESAVVPVEHRESFGKMLATQARNRTPGQLRAWARRHRELAQPGSLNLRHRAARAGRYVTLEPGRDGMAWLSAHLSAVAAAAVFDRLTAAAVACQGPEESRTLAQLRADALADYVLAEAPAPGPEGCTAVAEPADGMATFNVNTSPRQLRRAGHPPSEAAEGPPSIPVVPFEESARAVLARTPLERKIAVSTHLADADDVRNVMSRACDADIFGIRPAVSVTVPHTLLLATASTSEADPAEGRSQDPRPREPRPHAGKTLEPHSHGAHPHDPHLHGAHPHDLSPQTPERSPAADSLPTAALRPTAELVGHGPLDDDTALELLAAAPSLRRILTDPHTGIALDLSRTAYATPAPLRAFLALRDVTCRFTGCRRPAMRSDVDHVHDWADGGESSADNLVHLCRAHHRLKHTSGWTSHVLTIDDLAKLDPADHADSPELAAVVASARVAVTSVVDTSPSDRGEIERRLAPSVVRWTDPHGHVTDTVAELRPGRSDAVAAPPHGTQAHAESPPPGTPTGSSPSPPTDPSQRPLTGPPPSPPTGSSPSSPTGPPPDPPTDSSPSTPTNPPAGHEGEAPPPF